MEDDESEITPLDFLEAVYLNPNLPLNTRMRAAIESAPYRHPKLSATAIATMDGKSFAEALDRAIARSRAPLALNAPAVIEHDAAEMKKPMARYRRY
jgi:hypothetical protein